MENLECEGNKFEQWKVVEGYSGHFSPSLSTSTQSTFIEHWLFLRGTKCFKEVKKLTIMTSALKQFRVYYTGENKCTQMAESEYDRGYK